VRKKQALELEKEKVEQQREAAALKHELLRDSEAEALAKAVQNSADADAVEAIVSEILHRRHAQELRDLREQIAIETGIAVEQEQMELQQDFDDRMEQLQGLHEQEVLALERDATNASPAEMQTLRSQLRAFQEAQVHELQNELELRLSQLPGQVRAAMTIKENDARIRLKERQYREYINALRDLAPEVAQTSTRAAEKAAELDEYREMLEKEQHEEQERLAREQAAFQEEQEQLLKVALADLEAEWQTEQEEFERKRREEQEERRKRQQEDAEAHRRQRRALFEKHTQERVGRPEDALNRLEKQQEQLHRMWNAEKNRQDKDFREKYNQRKRNLQRKRQAQASKDSTAEKPSAVQSALQRSRSSALITVDGAEKSPVASGAAASGQASSMHSNTGGLLQVPSTGGAPVVTTAEDDNAITGATLRLHVQQSTLLTRLQKVSATLSHMERRSVTSADADLPFTKTAPVVPQGTLSAAELVCWRLTMLVLGLVKEGDFDLIITQGMTEEMVATCHSHLYTRSFRVEATRLLVRREWMAEYSTCLPALLHMVAHCLCRAADDTLEYHEAHVRAVNACLQVLLRNSMSPDKLSRLQAQLSEAKDVSAREQILRAELV